MGNTKKYTDITGVPWIFLGGWLHRVKGVFGLVFNRSGVCLSLVGGGGVVFWVPVPEDPANLTSISIISVFRSGG